MSMMHPRLSIQPYLLRLVGLLVLAATLVLLVPTQAESVQNSHITACSDRATNISFSQEADGEPVLVTDPIKPRRQIAAWTSNILPPGGGRRPITGAIMLAQRDEMGRWTREVVSSEYGDPWLDISSTGTAYLSYIEAPNGDTNLHRVVPGNPAGPDLDPPLTADHPAIAVDQRSYLSGDRLYHVGMSTVGETLFQGVLYESRDSGETWDAPAVFPDQSEEQIGPVVATGGDQVMVAWLGRSSTLDGIYVAVYDEDAGEFSSATHITTLEYWYWYTSNQFGATQIPSLAIARKRHAGLAYVVWAQVTAGPEAQPDIYESHSADGVDWSAPQKVNDDYDPKAVTPHIFPSVSVKRNGTAVVAWMDGRDDPTGESVLVYTAKVRPNGRITRNRRITRCPSYAENNDEAGGVYGDYFNFDASQGKTNLIFPQIRARDGDSDVFYMRRR